MFLATTHLGPPHGVTWPEKEQPVSFGIYVAMGAARKTNRHPMGYCHDSVF